MAVSARLAASAILVLSTAIWAQTSPPLAIVDDTLPALDAGVEVHIPLHARGGVAPYHWRVAAGDLPEGISLTPDGVFTGHAAKPGGFAFTVTVEDSAHPANAINKEFRIQVTGTLSFEWVHPPQVHGNRIDGVVQVSNGTKDDFDLTVIIVAVNEIGRATALGYQHSTLNAGTANVQIPFGTTLPFGTYIVHADAIAEISAKNSILRRQLQTPAPLPVTQGP